MTPANESNQGNLQVTPAGGYVGPLSHSLRHWPHTCTVAQHQAEGYTSHTDLPRHVSPFKNECCGVCPQNPLDGAGSPNLRPTEQWVFMA